jgi:two-component system, NtrC family, sensor kinase
MNIRSNIFLWVFVATAVPLTLLVWAVTAYSERQHLHQVDGQMMAGLNYMVSEIDRRLTFERDVVEALAVSPSMQAFELALMDVEGIKPEQFEGAIDQLATFLEEFQSVFLDVGTIRVLDGDANTVIKVRFGSRLSDKVTGIKPYPYSESEAVDDFFYGEIQSLVPGQVSYVLLPESRNEYGFGGISPMLDAVVPLQDMFEQNGGYLLVNSIGVQIDRILELAPRLYSGKLLIAELNPDIKERDGLILYDEAKGQVFSTSKSSENNLSQVAGGRLWEEVLKHPSGAFNTPDGKYRIYYSEYLPYPNQLISWVIASAVPQDEIIAPFVRIRVAIIVFAVFALIMSLLLANYGARRLADPIIQLADNLKSFARGEPLSSTRATATEEIRGLQEAFDYMAKTTRAAENERDKAELMLLQSAKLASIGEMAAGIGHEINNPLNHITALVRLIRRELPKDQEAAHEDLLSLQEETERASRIVKGILDFARQVPPKYTTILVPDWVEESVALVRHMAVDEGIVINSHVEPDLYVEGDSTQLQQVLINLILNAVHASKRGDSIEIEAHRTSDQTVELSICDQGTGISEELMTKLFDPFFTTKPVGKGSGLGLSISLGIIQHHGGTISVHNNDIGGVTVVIRLPITAQHNAHD